MTSPEELLDAPAIRYAHPEVTASVLRVWAHRGHLVTRGRDWRGRSLYRWGDVKALVHARLRANPIGVTLTPAEVCPDAGGPAGA